MTAKQKKRSMSICLLYANFGALQQCVCRVCFFVCVMETMCITYSIDLVFVRKLKHENTGARLTL